MICRRAVRAFTEKIAPVYRLLRWEWVGIGVPNEEDIEHKLWDMLTTFQNEHDWRDTPCNKDGFCSATSTGGLVVGCEDGEFYVGFKMMEFIEE